MWGGMLVGAGAVSWLRWWAAAGAVSSLLMAIAPGTALADDNLPLAGPADAPYVANQVVLRSDGGDARIVEAAHGRSVPDAARELAGRPGVAYATPNYVATGASFIPDDPGRSGTGGGWQSDQWNFLDAAGLDAPDGWSALGAPSATPGAGVTVAILDSGVAYRSHGAFARDPDLAATSFVHPRDFVDRDRLPLDENGHGTHIAATIGEATNNSRGLAGLAYGARLMPVRVLDAALHGSATAIARGIRFAARRGADVINLSLAFGPAVARCAQIPDVCRAIRTATRRGVLVVAAAGNSGGATPDFPAAAPRALSVGATTSRGCLAAYSNRGADLVAPGGGADAAVPDDSSCNPAGQGRGILQLSLDPAAASAGDYRSFGYVEMQGTSHATAEASAAAALVISSGVPLPRPGPLGVARRLACTATATGHPAFYGRHGRIDAAAAVDPASAC